MAFHINTLIAKEDIYIPYVQYIYPNIYYQYDTKKKANNFPIPEVWLYHQNNQFPSQRGCVKNNSFCFRFRADHSQ